MERTYIIPLRREWLKAPRYKRAKKAVTALKEFIQRHMKKETVKIGKALNHALWERGIKNPPHKIKVNCKTEDDHCLVELHGHKFPEKKQEEVKKGLADKLGLTKKDDKKVEKPAAPAKDAKSEAKPAETAKETKPAPKEVKPESKPTPKADKPAPKAKPESKPAKKEKTEKEAIQDSFDSAKKLNELTNNAK
ncbi:MAG: 50S ribosomal protein L31e [Candidatus Woesearchaeota archaeon]|nr:50S ribosomal protein L31e [Candidatus Woesearchaeota archaeon]MDP7182065.1 50S ribosomal protein L31e [Candidatus Woesearchaeota archaeon]MDP7198667.1 50S ribosomal protein L31e [Candidatus Woesearchaeota archaeon]MDP7647141.1 50S ribosomal protein L31e [Candidatus Woesearchaeota archaeon]